MFSTPTKRILDNIL